MEKSKKKKKDFFLKIEPVIERAKNIREDVLKELPTHKGIQRISLEVVKAAEKSKINAQKMKSIFAFHKLPGYLTFLFLIWVISWLYMNLFHVYKIRIAVPKRDTINFYKILKNKSFAKFLPSKGSNDGINLLKENKAEVAFIQGGVDFPENYQRFKLPHKELLVFMVRKGKKIEDIKTVCTSLKEECSHTLAKKCFDFMGLENISFVHLWQNIMEDKSYIVPENVDAVMVTKSLKNKNCILAFKKLLDQGFLLHNLNLGAWGDSQNYLKRMEIKPGYFGLKPLMPEKSFESYWVNQFIIALPSVRLSQMEELYNSFFPHDHFQSMRDNVVSEILQKGGSFSEICVGISILLVSIFGIGILSFRKRFNELNTLISLINIHQSTKDLYAEVNHKIIKEHIEYLSSCSDLLGVIDVITGYYAQQNSNLLFNGFCSIIHQRCSNLKINIQLKIQHTNLKYSKLYAEDMEKILEKVENKEEVKKQEISKKEKE